MVSVRVSSVEEVVVAMGETVLAQGTASEEQVAGLMKVVHLVVVAVVVALAMVVVAAAVEMVVVVAVVAVVAVPVAALSLTATRRPSLPRYPTPPLCTS